MIELGKDGNGISVKGTNNLFGSLKMAKVFCHRNKIKDPEFGLKIKTLDKSIQLGDTEQIVPGLYQYFINNNSYQIVELNELSVEEIHYFIFESADTTFYDKEYGIEKNKFLYHKIKSALYTLIKTGKLSRVYKDNHYHLCGDIKNSTYSIHVCYNSQIVELNKYRKENGERCMPFNNFDKYLSFYSYITRYTEDDSKVDFNIYEDIIKLLTDYIPEESPRLIKVHFNGYIKL